MPTGRTFGALHGRQRHGRGTRCRIGLIQRCRRHGRTTGAGRGQPHQGPRAHGRRRGHGALMYFDAPDAHLQAGAGHDLRDMAVGRGRARGTVDDDEAREGILAHQHVLIFDGVGADGPVPGMELLAGAFGDLDDALSHDCPSSSVCRASDGG